MKNSVLMTIIAVFGIATVGLAAKYGEAYSRLDSLPPGAHSIQDEALPFAAKTHLTSDDKTAQIAVMTSEENADESDFEFACHCGKED